MAIPLSSSDQIVAARHPGGFLQMWRIDSQGNLLTRFQKSAGGPVPFGSPVWTDWSPFDLAGRVIALAVAPLSDGRLQVFAIQPFDVGAPEQPVLLTRWKTSRDSDPGSDWAAWQPFPTRMFLGEGYAIAAAPDFLNRLQLWLLAQQRGGGPVNLMTSIKQADDPDSAWIDFVPFP